MARANTITPIFAAVEESVSIAAVMDIRKPLKDGTFSIAIRVSFKMKDGISAQVSASLKTTTKKSATQQKKAFTQN